MQLPDLPQRPVHPPSARSEFTVVVCTGGRPRELEACLASLNRQRLAPCSIVVVDNAPSDGRVPAIAAAAQANYVVASIRGVSRARNAGARRGESRFIAFIDDDMTAEPGWLEGLRAAFEDAEVIAVTGPVLPAGLTDAEGPELERALARNPWGPSPFRVGLDCEDWFERAHFGGIGDGNMAFRTEVFSQWAGFEERIGRGAPVRGGEEHFAFFELIERGHRIAYTPAAMVFHPEKRCCAEEQAAAIAETAAYACFVAANRPRYALRVFNYLLQGFFGRRRPWRPADEPHLQRLSRTSALAAFSRGMAHYAGSLIPWTSPIPPSPARRSQEAPLR